MSGNNKRPASSTEHRQDRLLRSQTSGNANARQDTQRQLDDSPASLIQHLNDALQERNEELQKEKHRSNSLIGEARKARSDGRASIGEIARLKTAYSGLVKRYNEVLHDVVIPYARRKGFRMDEASGEVTDDVLGPLSRDAMEAEVLRDEVKKLQKSNSDVEGRSQTAHQEMNNLQAECAGLRKQVTDLQQDALGRIEQVRVVSDSQFERDFQVLASSVKTFSRSFQSTENIDVSKLVDSALFLNDVSLHHWQSRARKKTFLEAWTWALLVKSVFRNPFAVFGNNVERVNEAWHELFGSDHNHDWPSPSVVCENWRRSTAECLRESANAVVRNDDTLEPTSKRIKTARIDASKELASEWESFLKQMFPGSNSSQVHSIVDKAFALAVQMSLQRCRLQITYPSTGCMFAEGEMTSVPDREGDDFNDGVVAFVVNPGLTKWGDARGEKLDERYDIVPCLVQLEPMRIKREGGVDHRSGDVESGIAGRLDANGVLHPQGQADWSQKTNIPIVKQEPEWHFGFN
ncbi:uncharacterized protein J4E92_007280 [Alternaria infectoria]|uniref:uncharacterized protein n=1 Tax=Alternaria infectoria TaxID=45303 RepID=UPI00221E4E1F|nr:uncharacterized protein J4E92_007280 [Alternaria infectoria]KAI4924199.1 hypothetical protein J4E92_007280 [Alternaria infectoria]